MVITSYLFLLSYMVQETAYHIWEVLEVEPILGIKTSDHQGVAYEGILVGYSDDHFLSYKIYVSKLNLLIITADVIFQEFDKHGKPYDQMDGSK